jgi:hypothetical protein
VDAAALRAVSEQAPRVAGEMNPQNVSNSLWAIAKLSLADSPLLGVKAVESTFPPKSPYSTLDRPTSDGC